MPSVESYMHGDVTRSRPSDQEEDVDQGRGLSEVDNVRLGEVEVEEDADGPSCVEDDLGKKQKRRPILEPGLSCRLLQVRCFCVSSDKDSYCLEERQTCHAALCSCSQGSVTRLGNLFRAIRRQEGLSSLQLAFATAGPTTSSSSASGWSCSKVALNPSQH